MDTTTRYSAPAIAPRRVARCAAFVIRTLVAAAGFVFPSGGSGVLGAQLAAPTLARPALYAPPAAHRAPGEIVAAGRRYAAAVRHCYLESGLKGDPALRGLLRVAMTVLPGGEVSAAAVSAARVSGVGMPDVVLCVASSARSWHFAEGAERTERAVLWFDLLPSAP